VHASRREDNARHDEDPAKKFANLCRAAEANRTVVQQAISSTTQARKCLTEGEPAMRGYWYEDVRWQKSVQRIARCAVR
jgi:hypothetical protein